MLHSRFKLFALAVFCGARLLLVLSSANSRFADPAVRGLVPQNLRVAPEDFVVRSIEGPKGKVDCELAMVVKHEQVKREFSGKILL